VIQMTGIIGIVNIADVLLSCLRIKIVERCANRYDNRLSTFYLVALCVVLNLAACSRGPTEEQQRWALATTGVLTESNQERHDILGGEERSQDGATKQRQLLSEWWGIDSREDLMFVLEWIEQVGHRKRFAEMGQYLRTLNEDEYNTMLRELAAEDSSSWEAVVNYWFSLGRKSLVGWDFCRYIHLCRKGYYLGYLSEHEAWNLIMPKARLLQETFDSWKDLGENYLVGRAFWSLDRTRTSGWYFYEAYKKLLEDPSSPWNTIPWELELE
jgi:hypothetical protein